MIGEAKNTHVILEEAAAMKTAYDTAFVVHAAHEGILTAKHELLGCLKSAIEERRQSTDDTLQTRVGHLVAHNLHLQADQLQKETYTLNHLVTASSLDVAERLTHSREHFLTYAATYIEAAREYSASRDEACEFVA